MTFASSSRLCSPIDNTLLKSHRSTTHSSSDNATPSPTKMPGIFGNHNSAGPGQPRQDLRVAMPPKHVPSFTTTCLAFVPDGMAVLTRCVIDSAFGGSGNQSCINPSIVEKLGLQPYRIDQKAYLADGSTRRLRWEVQARLSFQIPSGLITIPVVFVVRPKDSPSDSMILSTGVLHSLGGVHDHRTNPSTFQVMDPTSGELVALQREDPQVEQGLTWWYTKKDPLADIIQIIQSPQFLERGLREGLPTVAMRDVCTSQELRELMTLELDWLTDDVKWKLIKWARETEITEEFQSLLESLETLPVDEKMRKMQRMIKANKPRASCIELDPRFKAWLQPVITSIEVPCRKRKRA